MTRYVLHSEELGVYLGSFIGMGFWSKLDPAGQDCAVTFDSGAEALAAMSKWESQVEDAEVVEVDCADGRWCTIEECEAAGLPRWDPLGGN